MEEYFEKRIEDAYDYARGVQICVDYAHRMIRKYHLDGLFLVGPASLDTVMEYDYLQYKWVYTKAARVVWTAKDVSPEVAKNAMLFSGLDWRQPNKPTMGWGQRLIFTWKAEVEKLTLSINIEQKVEEGQQIGNCHLVEQIPEETTEPQPVLVLVCD